MHNRLLQYGPSCLINAQPLPTHSPAADDNSLIGCTRPRPYRWLVASQYPFRCSFGCVLLMNQMFWKQCVPFNDTTPIYLINLLWKLGLGLGFDADSAVAIHYTYTALPASRLSTVTYHFRHCLSNQRFTSITAGSALPSVVLSPVDDWAQGYQQQQQQQQVYGIFPLRCSPVTFHPWTTPSYYYWNV